MSIKGFNPPVITDAEHLVQFAEQPTDTEPLNEGFIDINDGPTIDEGEEVRKPRIEYLPPSDDEIKDAKDFIELCSDMLFFSDNVAPLRITEEEQDKLAKSWVKMANRFPNSIGRVTGFGSGRWGAVLEFGFIAMQVAKPRVQMIQAFKKMQEEEERAKSANNKAPQFSNGGFTNGEQ